jgi:hypothetical protein
MRLLGAFAQLLRIGSYGAGFGCAAGALHSGWSAAIGAESGAGHG